MGFLIAEEQSDVNWGSSSHDAKVSPSASASEELLD